MENSSKNFNIMTVQVVEYQVCYGRGEHKESRGNNQKNNSRKFLPKTEIFRWVVPTRGWADDIA